MNKLSQYLKKYYKIQPDIQLVYRPSNNGIGSSWRDRCMYKEEGYSAIKPYNHRMTLDKEVVIEFDEEDLTLNTKMAEAVIKRLRKDKIIYTRWFSGSKSEHIHFFIEPRKATNIRLLKSAIIRHYCKGLEYKPDLQMAGKHLIRAEYGLNEKTGGYKVRIAQSPNYPIINPVPQEAWNLYIKDMNWLMKTSMSKSVSDLADSEHIKKLLDTTYFNDKLKDGRTRILFILANVLKGKYEKKELIELLQNWYKYTNGVKLTSGQIAYQVYNAYKTDRSPGVVYIMQLIRELEN